MITLQLKLPENEDVEVILRSHLHDRLSRNRIVQRTLEELTARGSLSLEDVVRVLKESSPYVSAREKTWLQYARVLAKWLEFSGLGSVRRGYASRSDGRLNLRGSLQGVPYSQPVLIRE